MEIVTVEPKPVERTSEFVGTIKSRRSTNIQPQAEGFLTRIVVRSGDRVQPGALLMEIDSRPQQAGIASLEAIRAAREVDVTYARQEAQRAQTLLSAGAASQQDADRALNALKAAEAQARAVDEQIQSAAHRARLLSGDGARPAASSVIFPSMSATASPRARC